MSDLYELLLNSSISLVPLFAFSIGALGSLHCVGMCGGLALAVNKTKKEFWHYNFGRLLGYLCLAVLFSILGTFIQDPEIKEFMSLLGGILLGIFLLTISFFNFKGRELNVSIPLLGEVYSFLFKKLISASTGKSFGFGACSILLPCAISNGLILAALSLGGLAQAGLIIVFFWFGTLPAMILGVSWVREQTKLKGINAQRISAILFLLLGIATLAFKVHQGLKSDLIC